MVQAVLILIVAVAQTHSSIIFVTPNNATTPCPANSWTCYESGEFFQDISNLIRSNTTVVFLSGNHSLELGSLLLIQDKADISLVGSAKNGSFKLRLVAEKVEEYGFEPFGDDQTKTYFESSAKIVCANHSGFAFLDVYSLTLANLTLINCGQFYSVTGLNASIHLVMVYNLLMEGVSIQNGTGYGLLGVNVLGQSQIINSSFVGNNQFYKNLLKNESIFNCKNEIWITYSPLSGFGGGNVLFKYQNVPNTTNIGHQLRVSYVLVALGIDGFDLSISLGAGLSIAMYENVDGLDIIITNVTSYRNQADMSANFYLNSSYSDVIVTSLSSSYATSGVRCQLYSSNNITSSLTIADSVFECNNDNYGLLEIDTISTYASQITIGNCTFRYNHGFASLVINNCATKSKNVVLIKDCNLTDVINYALSSFNNNDLYVDGLFVQNGYVTLFNSTVGVTNCTFINSTVECEKSNVSLNWPVITSNLIGICNFTGVRVMATSTVYYMYGEVMFINSYTLHNGGALYLIQSSVIFAAGSNVLFYNNSAIYGGAIYADTSSNITLEQPTSVSFIENTALLMGGAIYIESALTKYEQCFLQINCPNYSINGINWYFENNNADVAGSVLYGGDIDDCIVKNCPSIPVVNIMNITYDPQTISSAPISSDPDRVCQCNETGIWCSASLLTAAVYPGQSISLSLVAVGQNLGPTTAIVLIYSQLTNRVLDLFSTRSKCGTYDIPYNNSVMNETLALVIAPSANLDLLLNYIIAVSVLKCPTGFVRGDSACVCDPLLKRYNLHCNISDLTVQNTQNMWIGPTSRQGVLAVLRECPLDYCSQGRDINVLDLNSQCSFDRTSVLCGRCGANLSMTFGTSRCKRCSNYYLILIIPFAIMGLLLVIGLVLFNITVSTGALNGIILYVNIVRINSSLFITNDSAFSQLLSLLIAWMNLDLGIETCFYDGMNSITKTWLQFVFPTYIFALVGIIVFAIITGRHSSKMSKLCRFNTFPVLATLILLSYSKILRTIITIFSVSQLDTLNGSSDSLVWQYDGNIEYLGEDHLPLFVFGLFVTLIFIIPFPTLLVVAPFIQVWSHKRYFCWVIKLKAFFDSYQAPHQDRYRFWPGFFLFIHLPLYLVFVISSSPSVKLFAIVVFSFLYLSFVSRLSVYKNWIILLLEMFFIANVGVLSALQLLLDTVNISAANTIVISTAVVCAIASIVFIAFRHIWSSRANKKCSLRCKATPNRATSPVMKAEPQNTHVKRIVEINNDKLRESLLDDRVL